jgi:mRNA interferase MazF
MSADAYNAGPAGLIIGLPVTSTLRNIPIHVRVRPPEGGLRVESTVLCDQIRALARERFVHRLGRILDPTMAAVEDRLRGLLRL